MDMKYNQQETGGVYVITNPAIVEPSTKKPLTKIGRSGKENPEERINSMNRETPVPQDFNVENITKTSANKILEKMTHEYLKNERFNKEYFTTDSKKAAEIVKAINEDIEKNSFCLPDTSCPVSDDVKKEIEDSGYEPTDYYVTPFSDVVYFPDKNSCPKILDQDNWKRTIEKFDQNISFNKK